MADTARTTHHDTIGRDHYGKDHQYGRDQLYGKDQYGRDQYGRDQYGRDQYGRFQYGQDQYQMSSSSYSKARQIAKAVTAVTAGGSLLVLSSLTLVGTVIALTIATPLLVIFSPILVPALITVALLITGFLSSGGFGIAAITVFSWMYKYVTGEQQPQGWSDRLDSARMKLGSKAQDMKDRAHYYGQQQHTTGGEHDRDRDRDHRTRGTHQTNT